MRITGGNAKGRILFSPKGMTIRPTTDQIRETIFNIIGQDLESQVVLDLFSGTGSFGIECLSRLASYAVFVDTAPQALNLLEKNLTLCGLREKALVIKQNLEKGLPLKKSGFRQKYDIIFLDPPYEKKLLPPILHQISSMDMLLKTSYVIAETSKHENLPSMAGPLALSDIRTYGDTKINIYTNKEVLWTAK